MVEDIGEDFEEEGEGEEEETISATLESFTEFFKEFEDENGNKRYFEAIKRLSLEDKRSLEIDLMDLMTYDSELADQLLENPDNYIPYAKAAIKELVKIEDPSHAERVKEFHARFFNSTERVNLRALRAIHLGKLISIDGILTRVTIVKPLLIEGVFKCGFCGEEVYIEQERGRFTKPSKCPNPTCLKSGTFKLLQEESKYIDWQKITLQERPEELPPGQIPRSIDATLLDDLVDIARPGDRITVTGILRAFPDFTRRGIKLATFHTYLDLLQLKTFGKEYEEFEINAEEEEQIKELARDPFIHQKITKSIAPSIYGYEAIKEAVALLLFGGNPKVLPDGIKIRGESNLLLIGDPGVAKCVAPGTRVIMGSGEVKNIEQIVEDALKDNINEIDDGFYAKGSQPIITMDKNGKAKLAYANIFWKRKAPEYMYEVKTSSVKEIIVTPTHPFFITKNGLILSKEAKELEIGDFIATPRYIPSSPNDKIDIKFEKGKTNAKHIYVPRKVTKELARFLGYICGDGCVQRTKTACTWFTNNERQILTDYINCAKESFGNINYNIRPSRPRKSARDIYISSIELGRFLENTSPSFYKGAENKQVPSIIMRSPNGTVSEFLKAYYDTDGYVDKNRATISVSSSSKRLLSDIQLLLNRFEIISQLGYSHSRSQSSDKKRYNRLKITSIDQFNRFKDKIGLNSSKKEKLNKNLSSNTNIDIIPSLKDLLLELRKKRNLTQSQMGLARSTYQHYERGDRNPSRTNLKVIIKELEKYGDNDKLNQLRTIADTDVFWDKIISIQKIKPDFEWVYDLQVPETHNFVANGIYVHNSQLLKYVSATAPRALYTSGKGSTAAGLTAAVLRDSDTGDFILEAGALILADRGVACLHEGSKVLIDNRIVNIESLFDERRKFKTRSGNEEVEICELDANIISIDSRLKTASSRSLLIRRKKYKGEILEVSLTSGFKVKVTPDHKLLDGNTLEWRDAGKFKEGDFVIAPLKLPENKENIYFLDIIPDNWLVILGKKEKMELKGKIIAIYKSLSEFNRKYNISKDFLSGRSQIKVGKLREILKDLGWYEEWRNKYLKYGRKASGEMLKANKITPELAYFLGFVYGDGDVNISSRRSRISITQSLKNRKQIELLKNMFHSFSQRKLGEYRRKSESLIRGQKVESENIILYANSNLLAYIYSYVVGEGLKNLLKLPDEALKAFIAGCLDSDGCISVKRGRKSDKIYETVHVDFQLSKNEEENKAFMLALRRFDCFAKLRKGKGVNKILITGREDVSRLLNDIKKYSIKIKTIPTRKHLVSSLSDKLPNSPVAKISTQIISSINKSVLLKKGIWSTLYAYKNKRYQPSRQQLLKIRNEIFDFLDEKLGRQIELLTTRDYFLDKIVEIKTEKYSGYVYDIYIPKYHNFLCGGIIVHNCIDEFDKMEATDRVAIHEAMEQHTISIAKAGIVATLNARTSILAAANPAFGRYDAYRTPAENIKLPVTILSRFDLIFIMTDIPESAADRALASHILKLHQTPEETAEPPITQDLLRKYISYARKNIHPILSEEAVKRLEDYYVQIRSLSESKKTPIAITARQLESLIRLAESRARMAFRDVVTLEDAEASIQLVQSSLQQVGIDQETGMIDIDTIMTGKPMSIRTKMEKIIDILSDLEPEYGKEVPLQKLQEEAIAQGIDEKSFGRIMKQLKDEGMLYEPKTGYIGRVGS
ncbi:MAG: LAGLIDADG family homing endonuclease [Candidatus Wukongarchaeota archaeon]|nr:LAGLIDADG family homing endonuclease [Candidatus Wukongarchaeota archaeon]